jgi:single-strand selective monofunctional uracil DNA glycosylase
MQWKTFIDNWTQALRPLRFKAPVFCVYNPLDYARAAHLQYLTRYASAPKEIVLVGMNPGPWGMVQTGVPFGEVHWVRDWLGIDAAIRKPAVEHPLRPIEGWACQRSEVSGSRLWGWAKQRFETPGAFFERFFVANYCPLSFLEKNGKNRTPDALPTDERAPLLEVCDRFIAELLLELRPRHAIGVGHFAAKRVEAALAGRNQHAIQVGAITHPSPANPRANRGWAVLVERELAALGVVLD